MTAQPTKPSGKPTPLIAPPLPVPAVDMGRDLCTNLPAAEHREWLVTNGLGGFASGTVAGSLTRRYHGLLIAALAPPVGRALLVTKLEEEVEYLGINCALTTNRWKSGVIHPTGYHLIERFHLEGTTPVWTFAFGDARLEKRIWMEQGTNTTIVRYNLVRGSGPITLRLKALINARDYHHTTMTPLTPLHSVTIDRGLQVHTGSDLPAFYLFTMAGPATPMNSWLYDFHLPSETERGLPDQEHHLHAGSWEIVMQPGNRMTWIASTSPPREHKLTDLLNRRRKHEHELLNTYKAAHPEITDSLPPWVQQLIVGADQFIARRPLPNHQQGSTILAGYPWFSDWGRDTMMSLPGLTLTTGRCEIAKGLLKTYASYLSEGMLPNRFPDDGSPPEYNTVDAALWYVEATRQYMETSQDLAFLHDIYPILEDIVSWYRRGTRFNIRVDPQDSLLFAGNPGRSLTWMDARVGEHAITPRIGKPIEINALWLNALSTMVQLGTQLHLPTDEFQTVLERGKHSFGRFWNEPKGYCFDVIDGPDGSEEALRPNQILAVSLRESLFRPKQRQAIVDACARNLLTSFGLRSLAPSAPGYVGTYRGKPEDRDAVYHQGTVWGWLMGPFVIAHWRVYHNPALALSFLEPFVHHIQDYGLGSLAEIFEGHAPHSPRGCIAQAWSVAEILRAWTILHSSLHAKDPKLPRSPKRTKPVG